MEQVLDKNGTARARQGRPCVVDLAGGNRCSNCYRKLIGNRTLPPRVKTSFLLSAYYMVRKRFLLLFEKLEEFLKFKRLTELVSFIQNPFNFFDQKLNSLRCA